MIHLSFDEWNVWFHSKAQDKQIPAGQVAPPLLEDIYTFEDAVLVGCLLSTLQNNCDRVKVACLAQLVNVIAPIMTENGGKAWAQTIFYPFFFASNYGRGYTLRALSESECYTTSEGKEFPCLWCSVVDNREAGEVVVFAANRSLDADMELDVTLENFGNCRLLEHVELYCDNLKAVNDRDCERVSPVRVPVHEGAPVLKKHSWNMLRYKYE